MGAARHLRGLAGPWGMAKVSSDEYRSAVAARIKHARELTGHSAASFYRELVKRYGEIPGLASQDAYHKVEQGNKLLSDPRAYAAVSDVAGVDLRWLVTGASEAHPSLTNWLEGGGRELLGDDERALVFLSSLPVGRKTTPQPVFWELAFVAYRQGLRAGAIVDR